MTNSNFDENFQFFTQGRILYEQEKSYLRDEFEERIRFQLETSDRLQGFQFLCDTNAGYGSLAQVLITDFIRDEVPKAPVVLYSLKNHNKFNAED